VKTIHELTDPSARNLAGFEGSAPVYLEARPEGRIHVDRVAGSYVLEATDRNGESVMVPISRARLLGMARAIIANLEG
jgi:hypothetical protein